jgi:hypothetical protein
MTGQSMSGLLFFRGGQGVRACVTYDVDQKTARMYSDQLGLLPVDFFVTFDNFQTVTMCQLAWRHRDHIGVVFEGSTDIRTPTGTDRS